MFTGNIQNLYIEKLTQYLTHLFLIQSMKRRRSTAHISQKAFQHCTSIPRGSLGQEGSGNYCLLQLLQKEGYALLLKPVSALTVTVNGLGSDQDT